jgi:hypothetical protein
MGSLTVHTPVGLEQSTTDSPLSATQSFTLPAMCLLANLLFEVGTGKPLMPPVGPGTMQPSTAQPFEEVVYVRTDQRPAEAAALRPFSRLLETLHRLSRVETVGLNWDSYGGEPPSHAAVGSAQNLVWTLVNTMFGLVGERAIPFSLAPLSGGGIQAEWRGRNDAIEVEINRAGNYGYLLIRGAGDARTFQEQDDVPETEIVDLVRRVIA